jgi:hypothetical protein
MGNTFSQIFVKNSHSMAADKILLRHMAKKGFVPTNEDEAQCTYRLVASGKSEWVTVVSDGYESGQGIRDDAAGLAKSLKTYCIAACVWDSDFMEIELYGPTAKQRDSVIVGNPFADDMPAPKGNEKIWTPLLAGGATWEQLSQAFHGSYTFVEDSLAEIAPLLGMDLETAGTHQDWDGNQADSPNVHTFYFKKKDAGKSLSLNAAFKQVFGDALEPLGFRKLKGKYPYFVRLVGGEIIHVVTYYKEAPYLDDYHVINGI